MNGTCHFALASLLLLGLAQTSSAADSDEVVLFDGTNLDAWRGYNRQDVPKGWKIEEGVLTRAAGGGDLMTREKFTNYELTFEWKISPGGNSGVIYKVKEQKNAPSFMTGPEYQVLDDQGGNPNVHSAGSLYAIYAPSEKASKPAGEWNQGKIVVDGNKIEHWLNGKKVVETEVGSDEWNEKVAKSKFKDAKEFGKIAEGHIVLQDHGNQVWYRNIKVKKLK